MMEVWLGSAVFVGIVLVLVVVVLAARAWLIPMRVVRVRITGGNTIEARTGGKLLPVVNGGHPLKQLAKVAMTTGPVTQGGARWWAAV